jgi:cytochrome c556
VIRAAVLLAAASFALAACGSATPAATKPCPATAKALKKIGRDLTALRAASKLPVGNTLFGNKAINAATDRFLNDVELAPISNLQRNRLIDHAMAAIGTHCQQCFQAFEAARPIPSIRAGDSKCPKA